MKILVVGAGAQGSAATSILSRDNNVEQVILGDINGDVARAVVDKINNSKVSHVELDVNDVDRVASIADGFDVIMDFSMPWLVPKVMEAALKAGTHYVNTAFDAPFWDEITSGKELSYDKEFEEIGKTALMGCGATPGMSNVYVKKYVDQLDTVENIFINCTLEGTEELPKARPWFPGWSPTQAMIDFSTEATIYEDEEFKTVPVFSGEECFDFKSPINKSWIAYHAHEEAFSIPYVFKSKGLKNSYFKFFLDEQAATFVKMGFVPGNEIEVDGAKVKPFDVLIKLTQKPADGFLNEERPKDNTDPMPTTLFLNIKGEKDGQKKEFNVLLPSLSSNKQEVFDAFGTTIIIVALPAVVGAKMCVEGVKKGITFAEELDPQKFIELMTKDISYSEILY